MTSALESRAIAEIHSLLEEATTEIAAMKYEKDATRLATRIDTAYGGVTKAQRWAAALKEHVATPEQ